MSDSAVLLVNLGSPASPAPGDVKPYLDEFLMDPLRARRADAAARADRARLDPHSRPAASAAAYAKIWTEQGSPLVVISERTRAALEARMRLPVGLAMRYGEPSIATGLAELLAARG